MSNRKNTRRALLMSIISLMLCCSMLIGTTFAWFTDEVVSGTNQILAGNLDVDVLVDGDSIQDKETLFNDVTLWEPGAVAYENLTVVNRGSLALKYGMTINFTNENNVNGFGLSSALKIAVVPGGIDTTKTREQIVGSIAADAWENLTTWYESGKLVSKENATANETSEATYGIVMWWEPSALDNNWNVQNGKTTSDGQPLHIDLGISVTAWQLEYENDSFNNQYDAALMVTTVAEAEERMALGKDVTLYGANEPNEIIDIPADYTGTLTLQNVSVKSIQAAKDANIAILGNVVVNANGTGVTTFAAPAASFNGTAIAAEGELTISGTGNLTAIAADVNGACGIGGLNVKNITIEGITIDYVSGSYAYGVGTDTKYYKDAPEGGAAIGSGFDGAVITLKNVVVEKAIGGSKAAGIGARYHTGVEISIENSVIGYVEGGVSAAGIGCSRVGDENDHPTTITIKNSQVTAKGGAYGAGIGSGYDSDCRSVQPLCTINITDSTINATGGKYAAGVGTGYHHAALAGEIKNSTVNAASGDKWYKDTYTSAMDIGFGITDPTREGQQTESKISFNDEVITLTNAPVYVYVADGVYSSTDGNTYYISNRAGYAWMDAQTDSFFGNKTIKLIADIDFAGEVITGIKFWNSHPVFDGQGHTLSNFVIEYSGSKCPSGLFYGTFSVKNLVVEGAKVTGDYAGGISGQMYGDIDNCVVKNSTIICTYWQGGGIVAQYNQGNVTNCTVDNCTISGGAAVGGLIGILNETAGVRKVENCTVKNTNVVQQGGWGGVYDEMFGAAVGIINISNSQVYFDNCEIENVTVQGEASDVLYGVSGDNTTVYVDGAAQ